MESMPPERTGKATHHTGEAPALDEPRQGRQEQPFYLTKRFFFGSLSVALYWAWIFSTYFTEILVVPLDSAVPAGLLLKGSGLAGAAIFLFIVWQCSRFFSGFRGSMAMRVLPFVLGPAASVLALICALAGPAPISPFIGMPIWLLMGFGTAAALVQVGYYITRVEMGRSTLIVTTGTVVSSFLYLVVVNMVSIAGMVTVAVYIYLAGIVLCILPQTLTPEDNKVLAKSKFAGASRKYKKTSLQLFFFSAVFGLALCIGVSFSIHDQDQVFIWLALCLPGVFLVLYVLFLSRFFDVVDISRILLSCIAIAFLPLPFMDAYWRIIACAFLILCFTCYDMLSFCALANIIRLENLNPTKYFAIGRFTNAVGVFIGWVIGSVVFLLRDIGDTVFTAACLCCVLLLVVLLTFSRNPSLPSDRNDGIYEGHWRQACKEIAEEGGLSPRESEVLLLLSRGRDTEHIRSSLFISIHTAKTHIYHIYKKLDIHSQQDVIDIVEQRASEKKKLGKAAAGAQR